MTDDGERSREATGGWGRFLELLGLCGLAVAQPVLAVFGEDPGTFLAYGVGPIGFVVFGAAVILVPPTVLFLVELVIGIVRPSWVRPVHLGLVGLLAGVTVLGWISGIGFRTPIVFYLALVPALAVVVLRVRWSPVASWMRWLAAATPVFLISFLFVAPVSTLLAQGDGGDGGSVTSGPPVVVIALDELPTRSLLDGDGHIDELAYPHIARLAADATWYRNHVTSADRTLQAVPALVTGTAPAPDWSIPSHADVPGSLFTLFDDEADLASIEWLTELCAPRRCRGSGGQSVTDSATNLVADAIDVFREQHTPSDAIVADVDDFDALLDNVDHDVNAVRFAEIMDGSRTMPDLTFVHVALPHQPWVYLPDGRRHDLGQPPLVADGFGSEVDLRLARDLHLLQVENTDRILGEMFDQLRDRGWYEDAMVVLTADHGVSFTPGSSSRTISGDNAADIGWTPLIIKYPGQRAGEVVDDLARPTDVVPTVAGVLGVEPDWAVDGRDLRSTRPPRADEPFLMWSTAAGGAVPVDPEGFRTVLETDLSGRVDDPALRVPSLHRLGWLIGRSANEVSVGARSSATVDIEGGLVRSFDPDDPFPPVSVTGTTDLPPGSTVAVTVNGRIGLLVDPAPDGQRLRGVLPVDLFRPGDNDLELYEVVVGPEAPVLRSLRSG